MNKLIDDTEKQALNILTGKTTENINAFYRKKDLANYLDELISDNSKASNAWDFLVSHYPNAKKEEIDTLNKILYSMVGSYPEIKNEAFKDILPSFVKEVREALIKGDSNILDKMDVAPYQEIFNIKSTYKDVPEFISNYVEKELKDYRINLEKLGLKTSDLKNEVKEKIENLNRKVGNVNSDTQNQLDKIKSKEVESKQADIRKELENNPELKKDFISYAKAVCGKAVKVLEDIRDNHIGSFQVGEGSLINDKANSPFKGSLLSLDKNLEGLKDNISDWKVLKKLRQDIINRVQARDYAEKAKQKNITNFKDLITDPIYDSDSKGQKQNKEEVEKYFNEYIKNPPVDNSDKYNTNIYLSKEEKEGLNLNNLEKVEELFKRFLKKEESKESGKPRGRINLGSPK